MTAYQDGDRAAFALLVERHEKPLWNFLKRFVGDDASAEDLLQETFARVVKSSAEWQPEAKFSTWLYTIARNLCVDHARRGRHRRATSLDAPTRGTGNQSSRDSEPERGLHEALADRGAGVERQAMDREFALQLEAALTALPEAQREVFLMREQLGLPFAEIAQAVGTSEATVKSRMRYALEALRDALSALHQVDPGQQASR